MITGRLKILDDWIEELEKHRKEMEKWTRPDDKALKLWLRQTKYTTTSMVNLLIFLRAGYVSKAFRDDFEAEVIMKMAEDFKNSLPAQMALYLVDLKRHLDLKAIYVERKFK